MRSAPAFQVATRASGSVVKIAYSLALSTISRKICSSCLRASPGDFLVISATPNSLPRRHAGSQPQQRKDHPADPARFPADRGEDGTHFGLDGTVGDFRGDG